MRRWENAVLVAFGITALVAGLLLIATRPVMARPSDFCIRKPEHQLCRPQPSASPRPSATPTPTPSASPRPSPTATATATTPSTSTPTPSATASASPSPSPSTTPSPTPSPTATPSASPSPVSTATSSPSCQPPTDLQAALNAGGRVCAGNHTGTFTISRPVTLVGGKVTGRILVRASDVTIDGTEVTGGNAGLQQGNIDSDGGSRLTIRNVTVRDGTGACLSVTGGTGHVIEDSTFARCQQEGYHFSDADNVLFQRNKVTGNNTAAAPGPRVDSGWEAGGGKMSWSDGARFLENESWDNGGPGIWFDLLDTNVLVARNRVHHNSVGIFYEVSSHAVIEDNLVYQNGIGATGTNPYGNGGNGIFVSSSRQVTVRANVLAWNRRGIIFVAQNRNEDEPTPHDGLRSEGNVVISNGTTSIHGWYQADGKRLDVAGNGSSGDRFWSSAAEPQSARFEWASQGRSTLADYASTPGGSGATYLSAFEKDATLAANGLPLTP